MAVPPAHSDAILEAIRAEAVAIRTPALVIDLDAVAQNVAAAVAAFGARRWMPHVKTAKQRVAVDLLLEAGVRAFKAATLEECDLVAEAAAARGAEVTVLLAHPAWGPTADGALRRLADGGLRLVLLADGPEHLDHLASRAAHLGVDRVPVVPDVDVGMHRTGRPAETWRGLAGRLRAPPFHLAGLSAYEGHLGWDDRDEALRCYREAADLARALDVPWVVTSGTHAFAHALASPDLAAGPFEHRLSPGTVVFSDLRSAPAAAHLGLRQAAFVATRVVSAPRADVLTADAGTKAIAPDCPAPGLAVAGHPELRPLPRSEEHLPLAVEGATSVAPGDLLLLVPEHVCTTVNLYREALWVRGGRLVGRGPVEAASRHTFDPRHPQGGPP